MDLLDGSSFTSISPIVNNHFKLIIHSVEGVCSHQSPSIKMIKAIVAIALFGMASAGVLPGQVAYAGAPAYAQAPFAYAQPALRVAQPIAKVAVAAQPEPYDPHPQYNYGYSVQDGLTGDSKTASESRDGDSVQGQYSLVEPDGSVRTVTYTADDIHGFNAVVDRQAPAIQKVAVAHAPVVAKVHAAHPVAYAQPIAKVHSAPLGYAHAGPTFIH